MKPVTLYFPDTVSLIEFLLSERISGVESNNSYHSLEGVFSHQTIEKACKEFGATILNSEFADF